MDDTFSARLCWSDSQLNFKVKSDKSDKSNDGSTASAPKISQRKSSPATIAKAMPVDADANSLSHKTNEKLGPQTDGIAQKNNSSNQKQKKITNDYGMHSKPRFLYPDLAKSIREHFLGNSDENFSKEIKVYFSANFSYNDDDLTKILLGKVPAITSANVSEKRQVDYFDDAVRIYMENSNAPYGTILKQKILDLKQLPENKKLDFRNAILKDLIWKMTPDQREFLRNNYSGIYGDATLADDINWLYFDTVVKMYAQTKNSSVSGLLKDVIAAPEKTRLAQREKALDIAHSYLTKDQRAELKKICKARHDEVVNSRNTALQVAIRENKWEKVFEYVEGVLKYAPPDQRIKLLEARADTDKGESQGESAFSRILINAPLDYVEKFMNSILYTPQLTLLQKFEFLRAYRCDDGMPAFLLLAGLGYTDRVIRYIETLENWERENDFDTKDKEQFISFDPIKKDLAMEGGRFNAKWWLIQANMMDRRRLTGVVNSYTRAIDNGHKECAAAIKDCAKTKMQTNGVARFNLKHYHRKKTAKDRAENRENRALAKKEYTERAAWTPEKRALEDYLAEERCKVHAENYRKNPVPTVEENNKAEIAEILEHRAQKRAEIEMGKQFRARMRRPFVKAKSFFTSLVPAGAGKSGNQAGATMAYSKLEDASEGG